MTTTTTTNYGWTIPQDSELVKDGAAAIRTLGNAADASLKTVSDAAIKATIVDAKGDLITATAADTPARLAAGTNGYYLSANSSASTGLEWVAPPASGGMTLISETTASALSGLDLTSISSSYKHLLLTWSGINHSDYTTGFSFRFNNDSGTNYGITPFYNKGNGSVQGWSGTVSGLYESGDEIYSSFGYSCLTSNYAQAGKGQLWLYDYASTSKYKSFELKESHWANANNLDFLLMYGGVYKSTSAISQINIFRNYGSGTFSNLTNTTIRLYGVS